MRAGFVQFIVNRAAPCLVSGALVFLSGCSLSYQRTCEDWKRSGQIYSTTSSCVSCVEALGTGSVDAVRGCAIGLDAAKLISPDKPRE